MSRVWWKIQRMTAVDYLAEWMNIFTGCRFAAAASMLNLLSHKMSSCLSVQCFLGPQDSRKEEGSERWKKDGRRGTKMECISAFRLSFLSGRIWKSRQDLFMTARTVSTWGCDIKHIFLLPFYTIESRNHFFPYQNVCAPLPLCSRLDKYIKALTKDTFSRERQTLLRASFLQWNRKLLMIFHVSQPLWSHFWEVLKVGIEKKELVTTRGQVNDPLTR